VRSIIDALGRPLRIVARPERIVSLVPSLTELLFELGLGERIVGVSDYCLFPADEVASRQRVGGQKDPDLDARVALRPDLVLVNKEENLRRDVERLEAQGVPVYVTDVRTMSQALVLPEELGALCAAPTERIAELGERMTAGVRRAEELAARRQGSKPRPRAVICVWRGPWMVAGPDTYMHAVLAALGADNVASELVGTQRGARYPKLQLDELRQLVADGRLDRVLLPSEPYPFRPEHVAEIRAELGVKAHLCDGTVACWYGPRTARIAELSEALD
jgi:ABC-type Fe3+-hydroxamate transport system substrate-binding protein